MFSFLLRHNFGLGLHLESIIVNGVYLSIRTKVEIFFLHIPENKVHPCAHIGHSLWHFSVANDDIQPDHFPPVSSLLPFAVHPGLDRVLHMVVAKSFLWWPCLISRVSFMGKAHNIQIELDIFGPYMPAITFFQFSSQMQDACASPYP